MAVVVRRPTQLSLISSPPLDGSQSFLSKCINYRHVTPCVCFRFASAVLLFEVGIYTGYLIDAMLANDRSAVAISFAKCCGLAVAGAVVLVWSAYLVRALTFLDDLLRPLMHVMLLLLYGHHLLVCLHRCCGGAVLMDRENCCGCIGGVVSSLRCTTCTFNAPRRTT